MATQSAYFQVENLSGRRDVSRIKQGLDTISGVTSVSVNAHSGRVAVDFDDTATGTDAIKGTLEDMGYAYCIGSAPRSTN